MPDIDLTQGQVLPEATQTRYQDQLDGTHALVVALGALGNTVVVARVVPGVAAVDLGKAEDQLHVSGDVGVMMLAVRNDTQTQAPVVDGAYGPPTIDDRGQMRVVATGYPTEIVQTPTITAGAYTSGDALGGLLTFAGAAAVTGGGGTITKVVIMDDDNELQPIDLVLFNQTFTASVDNAPFDPTDADLKNCLGHISIAATDYASFNDNAVATKRNVGFDYLLAGTSLFGQMVIRDVGGYAATDDLTVVISIRLD